MSRACSQEVELVVEQALRLFRLGNNSPTISELFMPLRDNGLEVPGPISVADFIYRVRKRLDKVHGMISCAVSDVFYDGVVDPSGLVLRQPFKECPPKNIREARACIPVGRRVAGLFLPRPTKRKRDLLIIASSQRLVNQSNLMKSRAYTTVVVAVQQNIADDKVVRHCMREIEEESEARGMERLANKCVDLVKEVYQGMREIQREKDIRSEEQMREIIERLSRIESDQSRKGTGGRLPNFNSEN